MKQPPKRTYQMREESLNHLIRDLVKRIGPSEEAELLEEMIVTALKMGEDEIERGDIKMINTAMKELRYSLKVFYPYAQVRKVAIFGSARIGGHTDAYRQAKEFAKLIVKQGWMVITGAASGIMHAGNEGAGKENSFGVNIRLPFEQAANPVMHGDPKLINFKYFFTRKLIFVACSDATILCPGGFGTHDEGFETLTLIQTGKTPPRPIVCLDPPRSNYWKHWRKYIEKELADKGMIDRDDLSLFHLTHSPTEAVKIITQFYKNYQSMRYIADRLVFRLKKPLIKEHLDALNEKFEDILVKGKIVQQSKPFPEEANEPGTFNLTRLAFYFDRRHFAKLNHMIGMINEDW